MAPRLFPGVLVTVVLSIAAAIDRSRFFPTLDTAIEAFRHETGTDRAPPRPGT